jgi:hypothetical protein
VKGEGMPTMFDDVDAKCPFFRESDKMKIKCDGITDRCTTNLMFATKKDRNLHRKVFCNDIKKHKYCEVYQMLEKCNEE